MSFPFNHLFKHRSREFLGQMDNKSRQELLLDLVRQDPTEAAWREICELFAAWPEGDEKAKALEVADRELSDWDDQFRKLFSDWRYLYDGQKLNSLARLVRSLEIYRRESEGSTELWKIANSEHVENLKYLTIISSRIGSPALKALSDSPYLANLRFLEIVNTVLFAEDIQNLLRAKWPKLQTLNLTEVVLRGDQLHYLVELPTHESLKEVDFSGNILKSEGLIVLSQSPWLASIEKLELRGNHIEDDGIGAFTTSPYLNKLKLLDLSNNLLTDTSKKILFDLAKEKSIQVIV